MLCPLEIFGALVFKALSGVGFIAFKGVLEGGGGQKMHRGALNYEASYHYYGKISAKIKASFWPWGEGLGKLPPKAGFPCPVGVCWRG
jgi:hypothetical protein